MWYFSRKIGEKKKSELKKNAKTGANNEGFFFFQTNIDGGGVVVV
jgi:hypothetical protein